MSTEKTSRRRRRMLSAAALGVAASPLVALWPIVPQAAESGGEKLDENSGDASNLGYRHDATEVDVAKFSKRAGDAGTTQFCRGCQFFGGKEGDEWGSCIVFQGRLVNANGWCNSWFERA